MVNSHRLTAIAEICGGASLAMCVGQRATRSVFFGFPPRALLVNRRLDLDNVNRSATATRHLRASQRFGLYDEEGVTAVQW